MSQPRRDLEASVEELLVDDPTDVDSLKASASSFESIATLLSDELRKAQG